MASTTEPTDSFEFYRLKFSDDGRFLACCSADKTACTYSVSSPDGAHNEFHDHEAGISDLGFSSDGRFLTTASDHRRVRLWDVATG